MVYIPNVILVPSCVCMLYVLWLSLHFSVRILYDIIVYLFVCMIYVVWLVLDGSPCRGGGGGGGCCYLIMHNSILCLDLMLFNPLLPIAGRLAT